MSQKKILVVEDEEIAREVLIQALETLGFSAIGAVNGRHALEVMNSEPVDLVLTDIYMPELNGLELLREMREQDNYTPVILITGYDADEAKKAAEDYKASALLLKPFRLIQLKTLLDGIFNPA
jgi:two-component system response regulator YesN